MKKILSKNHNQIGQEFLEKMLKLKNSFKNKVLLDECKKCSWYENFRYSGVN